MVIDWLVGALLGIVNVFAALLPDFDLPEWATADGPVRDAWQAILVYVAGFEHWIPIEDVGVVGPVVLGVYTVTTGYRVALWAWSAIKRLPFL